MRQLKYLAHRGYPKEGEEKIEHRVWELLVVSANNRTMKKALTRGTYRQLSEVPKYAEEGERFETSLL